MDSYSIRFRVSRFFKKSLLFLRAHLFYKSRGVDNIYLCTIQKSGSQWLRKLLSDELVTKKTNLKLYPAHRYEYNEFVDSFPRGVTVQGLYLSYEQYLEISKPPKFKTIYLIRDPRDIVVSWYYSMRDSHGLIGHVRRHREALSKLNQEDGINYCIDALAVKFSYLRSWFAAEDKSNVLMLRLESVESDPLGSVKTVFDFLGVSISHDSIHELSSRYSRASMRKSDIELRGGGNISHYRENKSDHRHVFTQKNMFRFNSVNGNLLEITGYEVKS